MAPYFDFLFVTLLALMIDDDYIRAFDGASVFQIKFEFQPVASTIKIEKGPSILHTTNGNVTIRNYENCKLKYEKLIAIVCMQASSWDKCFLSSWVLGRKHRQT